MKIYLNHSTTDRSNKAADALRWHRAGDLVQVLTYDANGKELSDVTIKGAITKRPDTREDENREHCRRISNDCDDYAKMLVYKCPECGELITREDWPDVFRCPACGHVDDLDNYEQQSMWDYLEDCLDVEYITQGKNADDLRGVRVCVAWGGPSIYLDTMTRNVELYWWSERAHWPLSSDSVDALDDWAAEYWGCL